MKLLLLTLWNCFAAEFAMVNIAEVNAEFVAVEAMFGGQF